MQQALMECRYCGKKLATRGPPTACDACDTGFHLECAERADELRVETHSRLLRSDRHVIECPECGETWDLGFDPSD